MPPQLIGEILQDQLAQGLLDARVPGVVVNHLFECHQQAVNLRSDEAAEAKLVS